MSYFEDQEDAWFENGCQGDISDVDPYDPDWKPTPTEPIVKQRTEARKARKKRNRANRAKRRAEAKATLKS
jgi:hypothetical protein